MSILRHIQCGVHHRVFDRRADRRLGIDASGLHRPEDLALRGGNAKHAVEYFGTPALVFRRALSGIDPRFSTFVDFGAGKGRVLLLAAERPFLRVEGIEFAEDLHREATRNIERAHGTLRAPVIAHYQDATAYELPPEPLVLYFFNPFGAPVLERVLDNVERSLFRAPREVCAIYVNPEQAHCFESRAHWRRLARSRWDRMLDRLVSPWPIAIYRALTPASPGRPASPPTEPAPRRSRILSEAR
jgi:SAM-dependent methyltransferase